jgi:hypothetical protein
MNRPLRHLIADPAEQRSIGTSLRRKRWEVFRRSFPDIEKMRVLDLGGAVKHWETSLVRPKSVVVLNLLAESSDVDWITAVQGDACAPPALVRGAEFDLVYSNSLIEHVGGHARRCDFASVVHAMASHHWVQTPTVTSRLNPTGSFQASSSYTSARPRMGHPALAAVPRVAQSRTGPSGCLGGRAGDENGDEVLLS